MTLRTCKRLTCPAPAPGCCGAASFVMHHPNDRDPPEGWRYAPARLDRHSRYSNLIELVDSGARLGEGGA